MGYYQLKFAPDQTVALLLVRCVLTQEITLESDDNENIRFLVSFSACEDEQPYPDGTMYLTIEVSTDATPEQVEEYDLEGYINDIVNETNEGARNRAEDAVLVEIAPLSDVALSPVTTEEDKAFGRVLVPVWLIDRLAGDRDVSDCSPFDFRTKRISTGVLWPSDEMLDADGHVLFALVENGDRIELWSVPDMEISEPEKQS